MSLIKRLPWRQIRRAGFATRKAVGSKKRPDKKHLVVDMPIGDLEDELRKKHFRSGWFLSWHYKGEDANLSRAEFKYGEINELQLHIRLFDRGVGKTEMLVHVEPCPIEHPVLHIRNKYVSTNKGTMMAQGILDVEGIDYKVVDEDEGE